jgi:HEAT repeat protein
MTLHVLTVLVLALYATSALLVLMALVRQGWQARAERLHDLRVARQRPSFEAYILDGTPLPRTARREPAVLLDLALRYAAIVRGSEARRIVQCLEEQGIVDDLLVQLEARNAWRRAEAAESLGRLRIERAVPGLITALDDPDEDARTVAARGLAAVGDPRAITPLARALANPSRWTLSLVAENLMAMGPDVVPPLLDLLSHDEHNVRVSVIRILGEIRDPAATPALVAILLSEDSLNMRAQAAAALGRLGGPVAESALLVAVDDPEWEVRAQAAKALGRIGNPSFAHVLARAMPDVNWWVRVNCAEALVRLGPAGLEQLELLVQHADPYVRDQAAAAMEAYGLKVRPALHAPDDSARMAG